MTHEDESPMVAHRSHFDTMPCPPPHDVHVVDSSGRVIPEGEDRIADFHRDVARKVLGLIAPGGECHGDYIRAAAREISGCRPSGFGCQSTSVYRSIREQKGFTDEQARYADC